MNTFSSLFKETYGDILKNLLSGRGINILNNMVHKENNIKLLKSIMELEK